MTKYLLFMILVLATFLAVSVKNCQDIRTDRNRLSDNQRTLLADIEFYRTKDSLSVASVERLTLTNREFRKYAGELKKTVEELKGKTSPVCQPVRYRNQIPGKNRNPGQHNHSTW